MRQIGTLPKTTDPRILLDYLLSQGVTSRAVESPEGWAVWVHHDDHLALAREAFAAYEADPAEPRFADATTAAAAARAEAKKLDQQYRKNVRDLSGTWDRLNVRRKPLTAALAAVCVGLFVAQGVSPRWNVWLDDHLLFFPVAVLMRPNPLSHTLDAIHRGEVWRLFTPALLHGNTLHLVFNVWWLWEIGALIEARRGARFLAALTLASALTSNIGQYFYMLHFEDGPRLWLGFSGVVYAMFGYLWMKGRVDPEPGMVLHPRSVQVMLLWLLLGFTGVLSIANGGHLGGLALGMLFGLARL